MTAQIRSEDYYRQSADHAAYRDAAATRDRCEPLPTVAPLESPIDGFNAFVKATFRVDPLKAVADLADDTRTEGFARRDFRLNFHD